MSRYEWLTYGLITGIICVLFAASWLLWHLLASSKTQRKLTALKQRVRYGQTQLPVSSERASLRKEHEDMSGWLMRLVPSPDYLAQRIAQSGLNWRIRHYLLLTIGLVAAFSLLFILFTANPWYINLLAGISLGVLFPHLWISRRINKRGLLFVKQFPEAIDLIVRGLRSGLPVGESFLSVANEMEEPVAGTFSDVNESVALGVPIEDALKRKAEYLKITEFEFFVTSIILQRETGGNLAEILENLSEAIRGRLMMRMKVRAMSSEARASAYIVSALPLAVVGMLSIVSPDYLQPLFDDFRGNVAGLIAISSMCLGGFIMYRMTQFDI